MFDNAAKFLPLVTIGAIVLGFIKMNSYYIGFNIDIVNYVGTYEMLLSLLPASTLFFSFGYGWIQIDTSKSGVALPTFESRKGNFRFVIFTASALVIVVII